MNLDSPADALDDVFVDGVRRSVTIDWTVRDDVQAKSRVLVRRISCRRSHPPDVREKATQTVLEPAESLSAEWAVA